MASIQNTTCYRSPQRWPSTLFHIALLLFIILFTIHSSLVQAQTNDHKPITVFVPVFSRTVNKLYIVGGVGVENSKYDERDQVLSLDLASPWNTTTPVWKNLATGAYGGLLPAAFSSDEQTLYIFHLSESNSLVQYNVQNDTWQNSPAKFPDAKLKGVSAVTDPRTGLIYLAGGYQEVKVNVPYLKLMDIFDPVTQSILTIDLPDPTQIFPARQYYGNVWSKHLNSIVYWGGWNTSHMGQEQTLNGVTTLFTDTMTWSTMTTQGVAPGKRVFHCMAVNEDGTMLAIYGGKNSNITVDGELWVLNLVTSSWSQEPTGPPRAFAACTIAGDQFLIWGGLINENVIAPAEMIIYSFSTSTYVKQYTPPAFYMDLKPPPSLTRTTAPWATDELKQFPVGVAIGGGVGGLVLIGAIAGFFTLRKRHRHDQFEQHDSSRDKHTGGRFGLMGLIQRWRGGGRFKGEKKDTVGNDKDEVLERTLKELEEEHEELEQQRQQLVLQSRGSNSKQFTDRKRGPTAFTDDKAEACSSPAPSTRLSPDEGCALRSFSPEILNNRRTVQAVSGIIDGYHGDGYVGPRGESALAQEAVEPLYGPSPEVNSAIPDLIYVLPPNIGMDWTKQQQENHPHTPLDPSIMQYGAVK
ncbi:MAG: hypothetical protein J3R72DRAFT_231613 [Linnemannia gamsii]|nr:MAG: hypothetical protein J3R72DRAFT_231613 [Linnemannia gamsii]